ncbi:WD repeat-containing protein 27-like [Lingula anatina]|uniref:WD repeat-containing protein 27-like n=1 Tax=Lingula anatina TaxID=7574 RepID=A0A1S3H9C1_LINAN|nr:WD repeat-containing protein 27-like [Lingula anatina]|eukprot:XP_013382695.1 WD repeat-containing protein 27-like [Lingula anatina]
MSVTCQHTMRVPFPLSHIQIACNGVYLALPFVRTSIGVWSLDKLFCKPLELEGHRHKASAMCFGPSHFPTKLCTAAEDYIIVWDLEKAKIMKDTGQQIRGQIIGTTLGFISYCCFSPDESQVAVCRDLDVLILSSLEEKLCVTLEGHDARVTCAEFCPHYSSTLVTAAEDRTFKVWNIKQGSLIYQSTIISSSPFLCLAMNPSEEQFAIGTADGQVRVYDLSDGNGFRCLHQLDVEKIIQKQKTLRHKVTEEEAALGIFKGIIFILIEPLTISSQPSWKQSQRPGGQQEQSADDDIEESEVGSAILGLHYSYQQVVQSQENGAKLHFMKHDETLVRDLLTAAPLLTIGTTGAVVQVNAKTLEQDLYFNLQSPLNCEPNMESSISVAGSCAFSSTTDLTKTWCVVGSLFENIAQVLLVSHSQPVDQQQSLDQLTGGIAGLSTQGPDVTKEEDNAQGDITVLSDVPLLPNSLLRAELVPKSKESKGSPSVKKGVLLPSKKSSVLDNQPLTFKNKVKSSGYTEAPRRTMFQPKTGSSKATSSPKTGKSSGLKKLEKEYPVTSAPPTHLHVKLDVEEKPVPIQCVKFSDN